MLPDGADVGRRSCCITYFLYTGPLDEGLCGAMPSASLTSPWARGRSRSRALGLGCCWTWTTAARWPSIAKTSRAGRLQKCSSDRCCRASLLAGKANLPRSTAGLRRYQNKRIRQHEPSECAHVSIHCRAERTLIGCADPPTKGVPSKGGR